MNERTIRAVFAAAAAATSGCGDFSAPVDGYAWCVEAVGANGNDVGDQNRPIISSNGKTVRGCAYLCPFEHDVMVEGEVNENIGPMDPLYAHWQFLRETVYDAGQERCEKRAEQLEGVHGGPFTYVEPYNLTCENAVSVQPIYDGGFTLSLKRSYCQGGGATFTGSGGDTGGTGGGDGDGDGGTPPEGPEIYGLENYSDVIDCVAINSRETMCTVDSDFADSMIDGDWVLLWQDDQFVELHSHSPVGMEFTTCGSDSMAYYLGFREGDIVTRIDGFDVTSLDDVLNLWGYIVASEHFLVSVRYRKESTGLDNTLHVKSCGFPGEACEDSSDCCLGMVCNVNDVCAVPL